MRAGDCSGIVCVSAHRDWLIAKTFSGGDVAWCSGRQGQKMAEPLREEVEVQRVDQAVITEVALYEDARGQAKVCCDRIEVQRVDGAVMIRVRVQEEEGDWRDILK